MSNIWECCRPSKKSAPTIQGCPISCTMEKVLAPIRVKEKSPAARYFRGSSKETSNDLRSRVDSNHQSERNYSKN